MTIKKYYLQIYQHDLFSEEETIWIDINALELHPEMIQRLIELGVLEIKGGLIRFDEAQRIYKIFRIREYLGVNLPGATIIQELLERIEKLQKENERLKSEIKRNLPGFRF